MKDKNRVASSTRQRSKNWEHRLRMKKGKKAGTGALGGLRRKRCKNIILVSRKMNFLGKCNRNIGQYLGPTYGLWSRNWGQTSDCAEQEQRG